MEWDLAQLRALSAAVSEGTFEGAARALHVTPSAISQRIRALETTAGRVLLVRTKPIRPTPSGDAVLRLARQVDLLATDVASELDAAAGRGAGAAGATRRPRISIAVNADSLATWVLPALAPLAETLSFDLHRADQEHTSALLRDGTVMAAVTADAEAVPGCSVRPLGAMRYRPLAAASFAARWFPAGADPHALAGAPVVVFDREDDLQSRFLRSRSGAPRDAPAHYVPSSADFVAAIHLGFGWGMVPDLQLCDDPAEAGLVELDPEAATDVVLHWQQWRLRSPGLERVAEALLATAQTRLRPVPA